MDENKAAHRLDGWRDGWMEEPLCGWMVGVDGWRTGRRVRHTDRLVNY